MSRREIFYVRTAVIVWSAVLASLLVICATQTVAGKVVGLAANDYGYNFSIFSFEDGSHVLQVGKYQVNWCDAGAACDSGDMYPLLELRLLDEPYQG
jgi:hypothetical protein